VVRHFRVSALRFSGRASRRPATGHVVIGTLRVRASNCVSIGLGIAVNVVAAVVTAAVVTALIAMATIASAATTRAGPETVAVPSEGGPFCGTFQSNVIMVNIVPLWNYIDIAPKITHTAVMRSRMDELTALAEGNDGLFTSQEARDAGVLDSVLVRLAQRRRLERVARGVYRIRNFPATRFSHYREAIFWLRASSGPENVALSHETALSVYGFSDANPSKIHVTAPARARLRRKRPPQIVVHRADLPPGAVTTHEGMPITTIERTIRDILGGTAKVNLALGAIADARREGFITVDQAKELRRLVDRYVRDLEQKHPGVRSLRR
jgi:predicted transcriptional regulator of viral defense system